MKNIGNVFILGDSYSTFEGYVAEGCRCWYYKATVNDTDVSSLEECWWYKLLQNTQSDLVLNCSSSGTTMCHTGYGGEDCSEMISFCARLRNLISDGFFKSNKIDTFLIFGGTNDSWANSPLGEIKYGEKIEKELFNVKPAYCYLIEKAQENCPKARIITIVNTGLKPEIEDCIDAVSQYYGTEVFKLQNIEKQSGHPNIEGMKQIYSQVLEKL